MTSTTERIDSIEQQLRDERVTHEAAISDLAAAAQARGGRSGRRVDGAYFTDADVAAHLARRAIGAVLLEACGVAPRTVDEVLARGGDLASLVLEAAAHHASAHVDVVDRLAGLVVFDPTCGAGSFLHAAWAVLVDYDAALGAGVVSPTQLRGVDCDADAVRACQLSLRLATRGHDGEPSIVVGDAEAAGVAEAADVVLGNPPFVRASAQQRHADLSTRTVPNRSAWIVERAVEAARPGARIAFVLPISTACTDAFAPARAAWDVACDTVLTSHFDTIPSSLFERVVQRLSIFEGRRRTSRWDSCNWYTTRYHRWQRPERAGLLERVRHVPLPPHSVGGSIAKVGEPVEAGLLARLFSHAPAARLIVPEATAPARIRYKRRWSYFLLFTDFVPRMWDADGAEREPSELKALGVVSELDARVLLSVYSSTLFWWYFSVYTDNRNVNRRDLAAFPVPDFDHATRMRLAELSVELMAALHACAEVRECTYASIGTIRNTYFRQGATRAVLDRIDEALAPAYGMSADELEFVLGFERRFRS